MNEIKGFFDEYAKFVDDVTSEIGKKDELFMERAAEISRFLPFLRIALALSARQWVQYYAENTAKEFAFYEIRYRKKWT